MREPLTGNTTESKPQAIVGDVVSGLGWSGDIRDAIDVRFIWAQFAIPPRRFSVPVRLVTV